MEEVLVYVKEIESFVFLGCVVYFYLYDIVFKNLISLELVDSFIMLMYNMVFVLKEEVIIINNFLIVLYFVFVDLVYFISFNV